MSGILNVFLRFIPSDIMRAPGWGVTGWLSRKVMENANSLSSVDLVEELLSVDQGSTIVEFGPGHGFALRRILEKRPERVYGVEISESFRSILQSDPDFRDPISRGTLHIRSEDAVSLPFLEDGSVDRVLGMNVIYFLNPLDKYLREVYRILKPGGFVVWGCKEPAKRGDPQVFVNTDWDKCLEALETVGFNAEKGKVRLEGMASYIPIIGRKKS